MKKAKIKKMIVTERCPYDVIVPYNNFRFPPITTVEKLLDDISSCGAFLPYNEHMILVAMNFKGESVAAIYEFVKKPKVEAKYAYEEEIELTEIADQTFEDNGHAVEWALKRLEETA